MLIELTLTLDLEELTVPPLLMEELALLLEQATVHPQVQIVEAIRQTQAET